MPGPTLRLGPLLRLPLRYPLGMAINDWDFAVNLKSRRSSRRRDNLVRSLGSRYISAGKEEFPSNTVRLLRHKQYPTSWIATPSVLPRPQSELSMVPFIPAPTAGRCLPESWQGLRMAG